MRLLTRRTVGFIVGVVLVVICARYLFVERADLTLPEKVLRDGLSPVQQRLTLSVFAVREALDGLTSIGRWQAEKEELYRQIALLQQENNQLKEYRLEAERLQQFLDYKLANPQYRLTLARVIARSPSNWFSTITVNRGSQDGIEKYMPVVTPQGLVGRVINVSSHTSEVLLITDPEGPAGAVVLVQDTRIPGIVEGMGDGMGEGMGHRTGMLRMKLIPYDAVVHEGDEVITSGLGSMFPPGIRIGTIQRVTRETEPSAFQQYLLVAPAVDFYRLEEVMIITQVTGGAG